MTSDSKTADSEANGTLTITIDAVSGKSHYIKAFEVVCSGAQPSADISVTLSAGETAKWKTVIGSGATRGERVGMIFEDPIPCPEDTAVTLVATAGGASVVTTGSIEWSTSS